MLAFRHGPAGWPFLWEDARQPPARWHGEGDGPAHYFADTPDGAWAEFVRHEEITDLADLADVRRTLWAVDVDPRDALEPALPYATLIGGTATYPACRDEAARLRSTGAAAINAPSAALLEGEAAGWHTRDRGLVRAAPRDGRVYVLFGPRPDLEAWVATADGRPGAHILSSTRPL